MTTRRLLLRFRPEEIPFWAARFEEAEDGAIEALAAKARGRGHLNRSEFLALCRWKTPRSQPRCRRNSAARIREATRAALATPDERKKAEILSRERQRS